MNCVRFLCSLFAALCVTSTTAAPSVEFITPDDGGVFVTGSTTFRWTQPLVPATRYRFALFAASDLQNKLVNVTPLQSDVDAGRGINEYDIPGGLLQEDVLYVLWLRPDYIHGYGTWQSVEFYCKAVQFNAPDGGVLAGSTIIRWTKPLVAPARRYRFALYDAADLGNKLVNQTPLQSEVDVADNEGMNAFAVPDGVLREGVLYELWLRPDYTTGYGKWQNVKFYYVSNGTLETTIMVWKKGVSRPEVPPFDAGRNIAAPFLHGLSTLTVSSNSELIQAVAGASNGANIQISGGTYDIGNLDIVAQNVSLFAKDSETVIFQGNSKLVVNGQGALIEGIIFKEGSRIAGRRDGVVVYGRGCRIHKCKFVEWGKGQFEAFGRYGVAVTIWASDVTISNSLFTQMYGICIFQPQWYRPNYVSTKHLKVHHNDFVDNPRRLGYAGEASHIGTAYNSGQAAPGPAGAAYDDDMRQVFEYNLVRNHFAESELISIKSSRNTIRMNIIHNSASSVFVIRAGNWNAIYGNWFAGSLATSVRIAGESNMIAFNYFGSTKGKGVSAITLMDRIKSSEEDARLALSYWSADKNSVFHNIFEGADYFIKNANAPNPDVFLANPSNNTMRGNILLGFQQNSYFDDSGMEFATFMGNDNDLVFNTELRNSNDNNSTRIWSGAMIGTQEIHSNVPSQTSSWGAFDESGFAPPTFWTIM